jgi:uncharacterized protein with PIN domain
MMVEREAETGAEPEGVRCDFCEQIVPSVSRIALDRGYERLRTPHREQFACPACGDKKERDRLGLDRRSR